jgi:acetyl/propionyl-CoA carboxylase alpha subunit
VTNLSGRRIAIANRAEIAVRIAATCERLGAAPVLLAGEPDSKSYAARSIGRVEVVGPAGTEYDVARVVAVAQRAGADFLHPGYGFLSERADLSAACEAVGIRFVGPSPATLALCGDKIATRTVATNAGVPTLPASESLGDDPNAWLAAADRVGFPLLVKPAGAGGGRGMRRVDATANLEAAVVAARREAAESGAGAVVYLERELIEPRHVEVQVAGDGSDAVALGDRDCSLQRRHQKVIEEAPAPHLTPETRQALHRHAVAIARTVGLRSIATCEFLLGADGTLAFLEVNPRIQVEHPVTELVTGLDLVEWQLRIAAGESLPSRQTPEPRGHAIEARVYAEDPAAGFLPSPGLLTVVAWPRRPDLRIDGGYESGDVVPAAYDPMIAKVIAVGSHRPAALAALAQALRTSIVAGVATNLTWLGAAVAHPELVEGRVTTQTAVRVALPQASRTLALAAVVARTLDRPVTDDPWVAIGPFRVAGETALAFHGDDWEEVVAIRGQTGGWSATIGGEERPLRWWRDGHGIWTVAFGDEVGRFGVVDGDHGLDVAGDGGRWLIRVGRKPPQIAGRRAGVSDGRVRAPLPGKVLRVEATVGAEVAAGAALVTLSAMKIELVCEAPVGGTILAVRCQPGDLVDAGHILVELSPAPGTEAQQ